MHLLGNRNMKIGDHTYFIPLHLDTALLGLLLIHRINGRARPWRITVHKTNIQNEDCYMTLLK